MAKVKTQEQSKLEICQVWIKSWKDAGLPMTRIAKFSGVSDLTLSYILKGKNKRVSEKVFGRLEKFKRDFDAGKVDTTPAPRGRKKKAVKAKAAPKKRGRKKTTLIPDLVVKGDVAAEVEQLRKEVEAKQKRLEYLEKILEIQKEYV